jgi:hypothetical protein
MRKIRSSALALASLFVAHLTSAQFADSVVSYSAGSGVNPTFTDPTRALGSPTVYIGYQNSDPFNPPFMGTDLVSVGIGGSITLQFNSPILNSPAHAFGLDFIIFGNSGFTITNGNFSDGGITDGTLFGNNPGATRVFVSADNLSYYQLNPALARTVDGMAPMDSAGDFGLPVNPALTGADFAGKGLAGIRALYKGSGGGTGYDISWAQDGLGNDVFLPSISFVRVVGLSGKSEVDAISVVPEPSAVAMAAAGLCVASNYYRRARRPRGNSKTTAV